MSDYELISNEVEGFKDAWLIKVSDRYYTVSAIDNMWCTETLVFESGGDGSPLSWMDVAGCHSYDHMKAINNLITTLRGGGQNV